MSKIYDTVMIGAGPSSLAAAIYTTREDISTLMIEKSAIGGLAAITDHIDNYPGFPDGIDGYELIDKMEKQARKFGADVANGEVVSLKKKGDLFELDMTDQIVQAKSVLIATGSSYNKLGVVGESEYYGRGVHYCATCDGAFYRGKKLAVVGGGNSAVQEAIYLTRFAESIDMLVRSTLKASTVLKKELEVYVESGKIRVHVGTQIQEIMAYDGHVNQVIIKKENEEQKIAVDGVFVFAGLRPNTAFLKDGIVELDEAGFVKTNHEMQTNIAGVFASGDVRSGSLRQVVSAAGEGAQAAYAIREYLSTKKQSIISK